MSIDTYLNDWADGKRCVVADPVSLYAVYRGWCGSVGEISSRPSRFSVLRQSLRSAWQRSALRFVRFVRKAR